MYVFIFLVKVYEWPPIGKIAAHSAYMYDMFHGIKYQGPVTRRHRKFLNLRLT